MANYLELYSRSPLSSEFLYFDLPEYKADQIFAEHGIQPRWYEQWEREGSPFILIRCRIWRKDKHKFFACMNELVDKMLIMGFIYYDTSAQEFFDTIEASIAELEITGIYPDKYEHLNNRAENLNLYLEYVENHNPELIAQMDEWFDGMPGYVRQ